MLGMLDKLAFPRADTCRLSPSSRHIVVLLVCTTSERHCEAAEPSRPWTDPSSLSCYSPKQRVPGVDSLMSMASPSVRSLLGAAAALEEIRGERRAEDARRAPGAVTGCISIAV